MSYINGKFAEYWIEENHPKNGLFRVYWTEDGRIAEKWAGRNHTGQPQISLEDCGLGIRYEWNYKDGKQDSRWIHWDEHGKKKSEGFWKNSKQEGLWTFWHENGEKHSEVYMKGGKPDGL